MQIKAVWVKECLEDGKGKNVRVCVCVMLREKERIAWKFIDDCTHGKNDSYMKHCPCQRLASCVASHFVTWMDRWMEAVNKESSIEKYIWLCYLKTECNPILFFFYYDQF